MFCRSLILDLKFLLNVVIFTLRMSKTFPIQTSLPAVWCHHFPPGIRP